MASSPNSKLLSSLFMPELQRQLANGVCSSKVRLPILGNSATPQFAANLIIIFFRYAGNQVEPIITMDAEMAKEKAKAARARTVRITIDDSDLVNFVTGGLTGVRAYMSGKIKVRGDLMLAQKLEEVFNKTGGQERALEFLKQNEKEVAAITKAKL
ncbi:hypothetical protein INT44_009256 [Umbelopsis vinacea]|uniref:SCP2 domain-containing protein n=1 Tax=Umbelopsis vinacea TaxID=44442 RepID=A0A8H7Q1T6_9FUNG|nr:hypothetical protein INT44_009256 [Umbelopsis vinacea]